MIAGLYSFLCLLSELYVLEVNSWNLKYPWKHNFKSISIYSSLLPQYSILYVNITIAMEYPPLPSLSPPSPSLLPTSPLLSTNLSLL